jgi:hypothetical protein
MFMLSEVAITVTEAFTIVLRPQLALSCILMVHKLNPILSKYKPIFRFSHSESAVATCV